MLVRDYELGFTFEIGNDFSEISKDKYELFGVDESVLHYFLYIDDDGNENPFSLIKGAKCASVEEYENTIATEIEKFQELYDDADVSNVIKIETEDGRRLDRFTVDFNDGGYLMVFYYTMVHGTIVSACANIIDDADEYEAGLMAVMLSIKETEKPTKTPAEAAKQEK